MEPLAIEPDTKDWTVAITEGCDECGFNPAYDVVTTGDRLRGALPHLERALRRVDAQARPGPSTWSPLEYGCHVRDVFAIFRDRLDLMLREEDPLFPNWDQDETAVLARYWAQDPDVVADEIISSGQQTARAFDEVPDHAWERTGRRSNGTVFTVRTLAVYCLHDVEHHVRDLGG